jgi:hypothetical protein
LPPWRLTALSAAVTWQADALAYHRELAQRGWPGLGRGIRSMLIEGMLVTPGNCIAADRVRRLLCDQARAGFARADVIISPTHGTGALPYEARSGASVDETAFTALWNLTGSPAVSVPMGLTADGLPLGLQLAARPGQDALVLRVAHAFQQDTGFHRAQPALREPGWLPPTPGRLSDRQADGGATAREQARYWSDEQWSCQHPAAGYVAFAAARLGLPLSEAEVRHAADRAVIKQTELVPLHAALSEAPAQGVMIFRPLIDDGSGTLADG